MDSEIVVMNEILALPKNLVRSEISRISTQIFDGYDNIKIYSRDGGSKIEVLTLFRDPVSREMGKRLVGYVLLNQVYRDLDRPTQVKIALLDSRYKSVFVDLAQQIQTVRFFDQRPQKPEYVETEPIPSEVSVEELPEMVVEKPPEVVVEEPPEMVVDIEPPKVEVVEPWDKIKDYLWDITALRMWINGSTAKEIGALVCVSAKRVTNRLSELRKEYGEDIVPYDDTRRKNLILKNS